VHIRYNTTRDNAPQSNKKPFSKAKLRWTLVFPGNNMATKNQIAHRIWIIQAIRIPQAKSS